MRHVYTGHHMVVVGGFTYWPILLVVSIIVMIIIGLCQYKLVGKGRIHARYTNKLIQVIGYAAAAVVEFSMVVEEGEALALYLDSIIAAVIAFMLIGMMLIVSLIGIGMYFSDKHKACLP